jgi:hypothetical protein
LLFISRQVLAGNDQIAKQAKGTYMKTYQFSIKLPHVTLSRLFFTFLMSLLFLLANPAQAERTSDLELNLLERLADPTNQQSPDTEILQDDKDLDGYAASEDCDDHDPEVHPDADEICDGVDNNCNEEIDEYTYLIFYADHDGDSLGDPGEMMEACEAPEGYVENSDDLCPDVHEEISNDKSMCYPQEVTNHSQFHSTQVKAI